MPYFRVALLSVRKPYRFTGAQELTVRICRKQLVHIWCAALGNGIALCLFADAPAIQNHQHNRLLFVHNNTS